MRSDLKASGSSAGTPVRVQPAHLARLEGSYVSVALVDGSRIDDCQLVSGGREGVATLWLFANGKDRFVPLSQVVDVWEATSAGWCHGRASGE